MPLPSAPSSYHEDNDILYIDTSFNILSDSEHEEESNLATPRTLASDSLFLFKGYCSRTDWKPLLKDKSGTVVHVLKLESKKEPIFRSEKIFEGVKSGEILKVVREQAAWDDWLQEASLIKEIDGETKLMHVVMKPQLGSKPRDYVLAEHIETSEDSVSVVAISASSQYLPPSSSYTRGNLSLSVWHLENCMGYSGKESTKVTFMFQMGFSGWAPLAKRMLAKRALVIKNLEDAVAKRAKETSEVKPEKTKETLSVKTEKPQRRVSSYQVSENKGQLAVENTLKKRVSMPVFNAPPPPPKPPQSPQPPPPSKSTTEPAKVPKLVVSLEAPNSKERPLSAVSASLGSPLIAAGHQHRHSESLEKARLQLASVSEWTATGEQNGIKGYKSSNLVRGQGVLEGWSTEEIVAIINNCDCRKKWDKQLSNIQIAEILDNSCSLLNIFCKGSFPLKPRNYCCITETQLNPETNALEVLTVSVLDDLLPPGPDRSSGFLEAWTLRSCGVSKRGAPLVEVTLVTSLEESAVSLHVSEKISLITKIRDYLEHFCVPPFLTRNAMKKVTEHFIVETGEWNMRLQGINSIAGAEIIICNKAVPQGKGYHNGWNLTVEPKDTQVVRVSQGFRIISQKSESIHLKVTPGSLGRISIPTITKDTKEASKTRRETVPSIPVQVIRTLELQERQVLFIAFVSFVMFYLGVYYERFILNGLFNLP